MWFPLTRIARDQTEAKVQEALDQDRSLGEDKDREHSLQRKQSKIEARVKAKTWEEWAWAAPAKTQVVLQRIGFLFLIFKGGFRFQAGIDRV